MLSAGQHQLPGEPAQQDVRGDQGQAQGEAAAGRQVYPQQSLHSTDLYSDKGIIKVLYVPECINRLSNRTGII